MIYIKDLPEWARPAFPNTEKLNRVQSVLYKSGALKGGDLLSQSALATLG